MESSFLSFNILHTHTHIHTHTYIYIWGNRSNPRLYVTNDNLVPSRIIYSFISKLSQSSWLNFLKGAKKRKIHEQITDDQTSVSRTLMNMVKTFLQI